MKRFSVYVKLTGIKFRKKKTTFFRNDIRVK